MAIAQIVTNTKNVDRRNCNRLRQRNLRFDAAAESSESVIYIPLGERLARPGQLNDGRRSIYCDKPKALRLESPDGWRRTAKAKPDGLRHTAKVKPDALRRAAKSVQVVV